MLLNHYRSVCLRLYLKAHRLPSNYPNVIAALAGLAILTCGLSDIASAQAKMNDERITCAVWQLLSLTEGNFGALMMTVAGLSTIIASAFGAFRAATSMLVVACSAFILRSFIEIFFNLGTPDARCEWQSSSFAG